MRSSLGGELGGGGGGGGANGSEGGGGGGGWMTFSMGCRRPLIMGALLFTAGAEARIAGGSTGRMGNGGGALPEMVRSPNFFVVSRSSEDKLHIRAPEAPATPAASRLMWSPSIWRRSGITRGVSELLLI